MKNKVKNHYTTWQIDNSDGFGSNISVGGISFPAGDAFSFDVWVYLQGSTTVILSQDEGFSFGINNNIAVISQDGKSVTLGKNGVEIPKQRWVNLCMVYDGKDVSFMLNGIILASETLSLQLHSNKDILFGKELTGYIRSFRLYEGEMDETIFRNYFIAAEYEKEKMKELKSFLDFTKEEIIDRVDNPSIVVSVNKNCLFTDLVDVYCPKDGGCIAFYNRPDINPGGFNTGEFSVYVKMYLRPGTQERYIVWENGTQGEDNTLSLCCQKEDGSTKLFFCNNGEEIAFGEVQTMYQWLDVIVSAQGDSITAFLNGNQHKIETKGKITRGPDGLFGIGGDVGKKEFLCPDYIHSVAVFNCALKQEDANSFMENHPFVLENGMVALVSFQSGIPCELIACDLIEDATDGVFPAQRTVDNPQPEKYEYRLNYTESPGNEMDIWEAEQMFEALTAFSEGYTGGKATLTDEAREMTIRRLSRNRSVLEQTDMLYESPRVSQDEAVRAVGNTIVAMAMIGTVSMVSVGSSAPSATGAMIAGGAITSTQSKLYYLIFLESILITNIVPELMKRVDIIHKKKPDVENAMIQLLSITLKHDPDDYCASAVRCRDYKGVITGDEWTREGKCVNPAVYIAETAGRLKIKIKFKLSELLTKNDTYDVSLTTKEINPETGFFKEMKYEGKHLPPGEYNVELCAEEEVSLPRDIRFYESNLWWTWKVRSNNGNSVSVIPVPDTRLEIYTIPQVNMQNVFLEDGVDDYYPLVDYLWLYSRLLKIKIDEEILLQGEYNNLGIGHDLICQITNGLYFANHFRYTPNYNPNYVEWCGTDAGGVFILHFYTMFGAIRTFYETHSYSSRIEIECEAFAALLIYHIRCHGGQAWGIYIYNPVRLNGQQCALQTNIVKTPDNPATSYDFHHHFAVLAESIDRGILCYDATVGLANGQGGYEPICGLPLTGVPGIFCVYASEPNSYRGRVVRNGTPCVVGGGFGLVIAYN